MKRGVFYFPLLVLFSLSLCAQKAFKDSLLKIIVAEKDDSIRCLRLSDFIEAETNNKVWPKYNEEMKNIAKRVVFDGATGSRKTFFLMMYSEGIVNDGFLKQANNDFQGAMLDYRKALEIKLDIEDRKGVANALINVGFLFQSVANYSVAFNYYKRALKAQEELGDKKGAATTLVNMSTIFMNQGDTAAFVKYMRKAIDYRKDADDMTGMANCYNNLSIILCAKGDYKEAQYLLSSALRINEELNNLDGVGNTLNNLGGVYLRQGKHHQAQSALKNALDVNKKIGDHNGMATAYRSIGEVFYLEGKAGIALSQYKLAYKQAQLGGGLQEQIRITKGFSNAYKELGDKKRSEVMLELSQRLQDSISKKVAIELEDIEFTGDLPESDDPVLEANIADGKPSGSAGGFWLGVGSTLIVLAAFAIYKRKGKQK
jgi:tetratricopeptide (TPR) repeat protein